MVLYLAEGALQRLAAWGHRTLESNDLVRHVELGFGLPVHGVLPEFLNDDDRALARAGIPQMDVDLAVRELARAF